jgi:hypothetical protein
MLNLTRHSPRRPLQSLLPIPQFCRATAIAALRETRGHSPRPLVDRCASCTTAPPPSGPPRRAGLAVCAGEECAQTARQQPPLAVSPNVACGEWPKHARMHPSGPSVPQPPIGHAVQSDADLDLGSRETGQGQHAQPWLLLIVPGLTNLEDRGAMAPKPGNIARLARAEPQGAHGPVRQWGPALPQASLVSTRHRAVINKK